MRQTLLEDVNANGNVQAVVEVENGACYFYLFGAPETELEVKSVWVRNLKAAPDSLDAKSMRAGHAPLNPRKHCRHPGAGRAPRAEDLRVVWLPEGNGAGLFEGDELIAAVPPWSGTDGFHGYARDCVGEGPVAWPLTPDNAFIERLENAERFWEYWEQEEPWSPIQEALCSRVENCLGRHSNYYAIDGGVWPPKAILRIPRADGVALMTIGLSIRPQPQIEMHLEDPTAARRIEFGVLLPADWPDEAVKRFASYLSAQSTLPWSKYTWLGHGHTIPCDCWRTRTFTAAVLATSHPAVPTPDLGKQFGDPACVLWFLPLSERERQRAMADGSQTVLDSLAKDRWRES